MAITVRHCHGHACSGEESPTRRWSKVQCGVLLPVDTTRVASPYPTIADGSWLSRSIGWSESNWQCCKKSGSVKANKFMGLQCSNLGTWQVVGPSLFLSPKCQARFALGASPTERMAITSVPKISHNHHNPFPLAHHALLMESLFR